MTAPIPPPPKNPEKEALKQRRELAEIERIEAEAAKYRADVEKYERIRAEEDASAAAARIFTFYGVVTEGTVVQCMAALGHWSRRDAGSDIKVVFASPGGSIMDGLGLFDFLRELQADGTKVETVALGFALSMGAVLLQAGGNRVMGKNASMMIHGASIGMWGELPEIEERTDLLKQMNDRCVALLAERSTMTEAQINRKWRAKRAGWWLSADEALKIGLVDEVR